MSFYPLISHVAHVFYIQHRTIQGQISANQQDDMKTTILLVLVVFVFYVSGLNHKMKKRDVHRIIIKNTRPVRSHRPSPSKNHGNNFEKQKKQSHHHYHHHDYEQDSFENSESSESLYNGSPKYNKKPVHSHHSGEEYKRSKPNKAGWTPLTESTILHHSISDSYHPHHNSKKRQRKENTKKPNFSSQFELTTRFPHQSSFYNDDDFVNFDYNNKNVDVTQYSPRHYRDNKFVRSQRDLFKNTSYEVHEPRREISHFGSEHNFQVLAPSLDLTHLPVAAESITHIKIEEPPKEEDVQPEVNRGRRQREKIIRNKN